MPEYITHLYCLAYSVAFLNVLSVLDHFCISPVKILQIYTHWTSENVFMLKSNIIRSCWQRCITQVCVLINSLSVISGDFEDDNAAFCITMRRLGTWQNECPTHRKWKKKNNKQNKQILHIWNEPAIEGGKYPRRIPEYVVVLGTRI